MYVYHPAKAGEERGKVNNAAAQVAFGDGGDDQCCILSPPFLNVGNNSFFAAEVGDEDVGVKSEHTGEQRYRMVSCPFFADCPVMFFERRIFFFRSPAAERRLLGRVLLAGRMLGAGEERRFLAGVRDWVAMQESIHEERKGSTAIVAVDGCVREVLCQSFFGIMAGRTLSVETRGVQEKESVFRSKPPAVA